MGAFDDLIPAAPARPAATGGMFDDLVPPAAPKREVGTASALGRAASSLWNSAVAYTQAPIVGTLALADAVGKLFGGSGDLTTRYGDVFVQPNINAIESNALKPDETAGPVGSAAIGMAPQLGKMVGDLAQGGPLGAAAKSAFGATREISSALPAVLNALREGAVTGIPAGFRVAAERQGDLTRAGVDPLAAAVPAAVSGLSTIGQFALPASAGSAAATLPGRIASRGAQGAALNVPAGIVQRQVDEALLPEAARPTMASNPTDPAAVIADLLGGLLFGQMGGKGETFRAPNRRALGYDAAAPNAEQIVASRTVQPETSLADYVRGLVREEPPPPTAEAAIEAQRARAQARQDKEAELSHTFRRDNNVVMRREDFIPDEAAGELVPLGEPRPAQDRTGTVADRPEYAGTRTPEERAYVDAGVSPDAAENAFARARTVDSDALAKKTGPEDARTVKAELSPEDARLIERYMGVDAADLAALGPNSQRRLLARAMEAQGRDEAAAARGPYASQDIYGGTGTDETGPASPASRPVVPGDRPAPESRTFDEMDAAAQRAPDPAAVQRKKEQLDRLQQLRGQRDAMLDSEPYKDLVRRRDGGEPLTDKENKQFIAMRQQLDRLGRSIYDLEGRIYVTEGRSEAGSRSTSGRGDRPFRTVEDGQQYDGRLGGDARPGESREQYFERKAQEKADADLRAQLDELEAEWRARDQARAQQRARQEGQQRRGEGSARQRYAGAERSANAMRDADGRFRVDVDNFVMSDKGAPIWFAHQRDAGWWILKTGNKAGSDQIFQIANHPSGSGFTVEVRGHQEPPKGGNQGKGGEPPKGNGDGKGNMPALRGELPAPGVRGAQDAPRSGQGGSGADAPPAGQGGQPEARGGGDAGTGAQGAAPQGLKGEQQQPARRKGSAILSAMRKAGGLDPSILSDMGIDKPMNANKRMPGLVRRGGMGEDRLTEWAIDNGWLSEAGARRADAEDPGGAIEKVREMIRAAFRDEDVAPAAGRSDAAYEQARAHAARQELENAASERGIDTAGKSDDEIMRDIDEADMLAELRDNALPDQSAQQLADQAMVTRAAAIDEGAVERMAIAAGDDDAAFMASVRRFLDEHQENSGAEAPREGGDGPARADAGQPSESAGGGATGRDDADGLRQQDGAGERDGAGEAASDAGRPEFDLNSPTRAELELRDLEQRRAAEQRARVDGAPPPEDFTLTGSDSTRDQAAAAGQRDFLDEAGSKLYSNPIGPAVEAVVAGVRRMLGDAKEWGAYAGHLKDLTKELFTNPRELLRTNMTGADGQNKAMAVWRWFNEDLGRRARIIVEKAGNSPTARQIVDMMDFEMGRGEGTGKVFREAMQERENGAYNTLGPTLSAVEKLGESLRKAAGGNSLKRAEFHQQAWEHIIERVENPHLARQGEIGRIAGEVEKWLKAQREMQVKAGVEIGDVGRAYFPARYMPEKIAGKEQAFIADATKAYQAEGVPAKDAAEMAKGLLDVLTLGDPSGLTGVRAGLEASPTKERAFTTAQARNIMRKWRDLDGRNVLLDYAHNAAKRASVAERFGNNFANWRDFEEKIRKEGGAGAIPALRELVEIGVGINRARGFGADAADSARMAMTMSALEKSVLPNLMELVTPLATSNGSIRAGLTTLRTNIHAVLSAVGMMPKSQRREAVRELMESFGALSSIGAQQQSMLRYSGSEVARNRMSKATQRFFDGIGLNQLTEAQRVSAGDIGAVWLDSLAKSVAGKSAVFKGMFGGSDAHHMRDMGVPAGKEAEFAKFVMGLKGQVPDAATLRAKGEMGQLYADVLRRFVHTTIQHGDAVSRPAWASSPWGSLIYQFGAYMGTFHKNVIRRQWNNIWEAGAQGKGYTAADRLALAGGMVPGMMMMGAASYLVMAARDEVFNELAGTKKNLTETAKVERAVTNANLVGKYGRLFEQVSQQRYGQGAASIFLPPGAQQLAKGIDAMMQSAQEGSGKNAGERALTKWVFNTILEPVWQIALSAGPGMPAGAAAVALRTFAPSAAEGPFVDEIAGPKRTADKNRPVKGVTELIFSDGGGRTKGIP